MIGPTWCVCCRRRCIRDLRQCRAAGLQQQRTLCIREPSRSIVDPETSLLQPEGQERVKQDKNE